MPLQGVLRLAELGFNALTDAQPGLADPRGHRLDVGQGAHRALGTGGVFIVYCGVAHGYVYLRISVPGKAFPFTWVYLSPGKGLHGKSRRNRPGVIRTGFLR